MEHRVGSQEEVREVRDSGGEPGNEHGEGNLRGAERRVFLADGLEPEGAQILVAGGRRVGHDLGGGEVGHLFPQGGEHARNAVFHGHSDRRVGGFTVLFRLRALCDDSLREIQAVSEVGKESSGDGRREDRVQFVRERTDMLVFGHDVTRIQQIITGCQ